MLWLADLLEKEPVEAHRVISECIKRFGLKDQIAIQIANFDLRSLPMQNIAQIKHSLVAFVESFMVEHRADIINAVRRIEGEAMGTVRQAIIRFNPASIPQPWLERTKHDLTNFCYIYLERELGELVEKAIPALGMYALISRKIDLFSSQQLEQMIRRLCKTELKWLAYLGGFIGGWLGLIQILVNVYVH